MEENEVEEIDGEDILATGRKRAEIAREAWSEIYKKADEDLAFLSDERGAQWDTAIYQERLNSGRPVIEVDLVSQFVHQVVNDIRMNTPTIKCIPHRNGADAETAEILDGLIKDIEYQSGADEAYDTAADFAVKSSLGFIVVEHDYADEVGTEQELCIKRVVNPASCLLDPGSVEIDGSDAMWGFRFDPISVAEFKKRYPKNEPCSFWDDAKETKARGDAEEVTVAYYYWIENQPIEREEGEDAPIREATRRKVNVAVLSGKDVLKQGDGFPGEYIPIVPVYGKESWEGGKRKLQSLIRKSKSPAFMNNLWKSLETEVLMKQPMAPVMAAEGQLEDYAEDWKDPAKAMALRYRVTDVDGKPVPAPVRLMPPTYPAAFAQAARGSLEDIKGSMGMYNASLGQRDNETSGIAIARRQQEGDVATYHFGDNLVKSITQVGRILVSAIPEIYDTPRIIRTIDGEDNPKMVGINGEVVEGQERSFDLSQGKYSVRVITGPSFTTQRQEAAQVLAHIMQQQPELVNVAGDILFKNMDFPGAQAVAERFKKLLPPNLQDEGEQQADPEKMQMAQALEQGQQVLAQMQQELEATKQQLANKQRDNAIKARGDTLKAETDRMKIQLDAEKFAAEQENKRAELALKAQELAFKQAEAAQRAIQPAPQPEPQQQF